MRTAGRIELARLDLGGLQPVEEGTREKVLERRARGVHAGAGAGSTGRRLARDDAARDSELGDLDRVEAAPLRRLSQTTKSTRPFSVEWSRRMRPDEHVVGADRGVVGGHLR